MPTFIVTMNWTDQGIRAIKDSPKRAEAARALAGKLGVTIKDVYLTSGDNDLLVIAEGPDTNSAAKMALALGSLGNVRTRTVMAWPEAEMEKIISELP